MVQLIVGEKGKGKTKLLLEQVNKTVSEIDGNAVFVDRSTDHMYDLNNKVRLIDSSQFALKDSHEFVGFLCGILSQDHDLEYVYLDALMKLSNVNPAELPPVIYRLEELSQMFQVNFVASVTCSEADLAPELNKYISTSL